MVKSIQDLSSNDLPEPLNRTNHWRILGQSEVWSHVVVVGSIGLEDQAQVVFTQDHDVIQALSAD